MGAYFEGLHHADSAALRRVFHPDLVYIGATHGDEVRLDLESYMARIDAREPPAARGDARSEAILDIAFAGPGLARVMARMSMMGRDYVDLLTLIRHNGEWRIAAKVFTYTAQEA